MIIFLYASIFIIGIAILYFVEQWLVDSLIQIARFLKWKKFVLAFFTIALGASLTNFFVGISSAIHGYPILSFGDVLGGNVIDLTLAVAIAALFSKRGIPAGSKTIQTSLYFTVAAAVMPILLIFDGLLSRADGIILIFFFLMYFAWVFSKRSRFQERYDHTIGDPAKEFKKFLKNVGKTAIGFLLVLAAADAIVRSSVFFSLTIGIPLELVGLFIIGVGNAIPETYFAVLSARRNEEWLILGNLMGSVVIAATLVIGVVAIIHPIQINDFSVFAVARFFLIMAAVFFFLFARSDKKITKREGFFLIAIYIAFIVAEAIIK